MTIRKFLAILAICACVGCCCSMTYAPAAPEAAPAVLCVQR